VSSLNSIPKPGVQFNNKSGIRENRLKFMVTQTPRRWTKSRFRRKKKMN